MSMSSPWSSKMVTTSRASSPLVVLLGCARRRGNTCGPLQGAEPDEPDEPGPEEKSSKAGIRTARVTCGRVRFLSLARANLFGDSSVMTRTFLDPWEERHVSATISSLSFTG